MKRTRRNHGAAFKAQAPFAAVKGEKTLAELATQFGGHPTQITEWKQHLLARAVDVFGGTMKTTSDAPDLKVLHAKIGQLGMENDFLEGALITRTKAASSPARSSRGLLKDHGIQISMDGAGCWRDNVFVERLWRSVKYEEVYVRVYDSISAARQELGQYLTFSLNKTSHLLII